MRLIDADRLLSDRMKSKYYHLPNGDIAIPIIDIEHAPTVEERKTGKWIKLYAGNYKCSVCGDWWRNDDKEMDEDFKFCPNCGADMRGEQDE